LIHIRHFLGEVDQDRSIVPLEIRSRDERLSVKVWSQLTRAADGIELELTPPMTRAQFLR
jgi:hypothetical protein